MGKERLIDERVRDTVAAVEACANPLEADRLLVDLVTLLAARCIHPGIRDFYDHYRAGTPASDAPYPMTNGWATAFDPLLDEADIQECWTAHGAVVCAAAAPSDAVAAACIDETFTALSGGRCEAENQSSHTAIPGDAKGVPLLSRGFLEIYHDATLADLRQSLRVYLHHVLLWGRADLWTSFDRMGLKPTDGADARGLPLHVDQNPRIHPGFTTIQSVLALRDCPPESGPFLIAAGSRDRFADYAAFARERGDYVALPEGTPLHAAMSTRAQLLPLRAGDLVTWDSRTTHASGTNVSPRCRRVAYIAAGPARPQDPEAVAARAESLRTGRGWNLRGALMHATQKPRFADDGRLARLRRPERLTQLGRLLHGQESYDAFLP